MVSSFLSLDVLSTVVAKFLISLLSLLSLLSFYLMLLRVILIFFSVIYVGP